MRQTHLTARCAPIAIAAMLALGSTPAFAQEAAPQMQTTPSAPVSLLPPTAPPPVRTDPLASAPVAQPRETIVISNPVVQAVPAPTPAPTAAEADSPSAPATTATAAPRAAATNTATRSRNVVAPVPAAPSASAPDSVAASSNPMAVADGEVAAEATAGDMMAETPIAPIGATPVEPAATVDAGESGWIALLAMALAGAIPIAVVLIGYTLWRRRSRKLDSRIAITPAPLVARAPTVRPIEKREPIFAAAPAPTIEREPRIPVDTPLWTAPNPAIPGGVIVAERPPRLPEADEAPQQRSFTPARKGRVPLPQTIPATYAERDALMRRLVAAEPDRANPFRSPRARARRAKLIIQSLERKFERAAPRFDLSEYADRWPALARSPSAMA